MADRLTQLQDAVNLQAENFCNSLGILQQFANPSSFGEFDKASKPTNSNNEDYGQLFASLIARTAKDMDVLIDSLPGEEASPELQANNLRRLEVENVEAATRLQEVVTKGEELLTQIENALEEIALQQLGSRNPNMITNTEHSSSQNIPSQCSLTNPPQNTQSISKQSNPDPTTLSVPSSHTPHTHNTTPNVYNYS